MGVVRGGVEKEESASVSGFRVDTSVAMATFPGRELKAYTGAGRQIYTRFTRTGIGETGVGRKWDEKKNR